MECSFSISSICLCSRIRDNNLIIMRAHHTLYTKWRNRKRKRKRNTHRLRTRKNFLKKTTEKAEQRLLTDMQFSNHCVDEKGFFLSVRSLWSPSFFIVIHVCRINRISKYIETILWMNVEIKMHESNWESDMMAWLWNSKIRQIVLSLRF